MNVPVADVSIYPNPANEVFHLTSRSKMTEVELISISGATVRHDMINSNAYNLNIVDLPQGIYMMKIKTAETLVVKRVIVE